MMKISTNFESYNLKETYEAHSFFIRLQITVSYQKTMNCMSNYCLFFQTSMQYYIQLAGVSLSFLNTV